MNNSSNEIRGYLQLKTLNLIMKIEKPTLFKNWIFLIFLVLTAPFSAAQSGYVTELRNSIAVPNSPEAEAFTKYGNIDVSLYTGMPNINVPIHVYNGQELDIPITLTYDASGVKVEQMATQAGLNWNLNLGGRISRIVNGAPDDYISAFPGYLTFKDKITVNDTVSEKILDYRANSTRFSSVEKAKQYLTFLKDVNDGFIDTQLDFYSLNAIGIHDMVVFDLGTHKPRTLNNPRIKVEAFYDGNSLDSWKVINEDGTEFYFAEKEMTRTEDNDWGGSADQTANLYGILKNYNASWLLTKIISANKKDVYDFEYTSFGLWEQEGPTEVAVSESNNVDDGNLVNNFYPIGSGSQIRFRRRYLLDQHFLTGVRHNNVPVVTISLKSRNDHQWNSALNEIKVYNTSHSDPIKWVRFEHTYFGEGNTYLHKRLKLDAVKFLDAKGNDIGNTYRFEYNDPNEVPERYSLARDYLGYYNGVNNNSVLYPRIEIGGDIYAGADRSVSFSHASKGMLIKMTYPTKGYSVFNYESPGNITKNVPFTEEVIKGFHSLRGGDGTANADDCGPGCMDHFSSYIPKISHKVIRIRQSGYYNIGTVNIYRPSGSATDSNTSNYRGLAYLVKLNNSHEIPFDDVVFGFGQVKSFRSLQTPSNGEEVVEKRVFLEGGYYQIALANNYPGGQTAIKIFREENRIREEVIGEYAGIRLKKIRNYSNIGKFSNATEYHYVKDLETRESSRKIVFQPMLNYEVRRKVQVNLGGLGGSGLGSSDEDYTSLMVRVNGSSGGSQPYIAYEKVFVAQTDNAEAGTSDTFPLGYTEYTYKVDKAGLQSTGVPPNISSYYTVGNDIGKEKSIKTKNSQDRIVQEVNNTYTGRVFYTQRAPYTVHNEEINFHYSMIKEDNGAYIIDKVPAEKRCLAPPGRALDFYKLCADNQEPLRPQICNASGNTCFGIPEMASLEFRWNAMTGEYFNTLSVEKKTYGTDRRTIDFKELVETDYSGPGFLPRAVKTHSSSGDRLQRYSYPQDFTDPVYVNMVRDNQLNRPVKTETKSYINTTTTESLVQEEMQYSQIGNGFYPTIVKTKIKDGPLEERERYRYNTEGNIVERYHSNGETVPVAYLWGYKGKRIIAQVVNATYAQLTQNLGNTINHLNNNNLSDVEIRNALRPLREALPKAQLTVYTYYLGRGVTSITDPNGLTQYFEYDKSGRLITVKDPDLNIIRQNEYQYRSN